MESKRRAMFQIFLKHRPPFIAHRFLDGRDARLFVGILSHPNHPICSSEYASEPLDDIVAKI
jgi:hypothetical protein